MPPALILKRNIEIYGVMAVMGRPTLSANEIRAMNTSQAVVDAYQSRKASGDWAAWAKDHGHENNLLIRAMGARANGDS